MAFKAVNDTAGLDDLVSTFFFFGAHPYIVTDSPPSLSKQQQAYVLAKAISKLHKLKAQQRVQEAFNTWNGLDTI